MTAAEPEHTSLAWAVVVPVVGLLVWVVKAIIERIAAAQDKLIDAVRALTVSVDRIPEAVRDALREHHRI